MEDDFIDDDFGELYADLQLLPTPPSHQQHDDNDNADGGGNLNNNNDADADADANDDYIGTDSDDDDGLKIVLNDDDCPGGVSVARDDGTDNVRGEGLGNNAEECIHDQSKFVSSDGYSKNGAKGGYGSQFFRSKFMKTQGSMFVNNNMKASKSIGLNKDCSSFTQGRGDNVQNQISSSSYFGGSFLPWHWNIYDINIDKLEEKPWRNPGADITDYFNFGLNENTWKQYCSSLASTQEQFDQPVSESLHSNSSKCQVPKGRAIQVEDSVVERQPSIHLRRPRSIDSDVIIQIKVHGSSDDNSGSVKSNVHDLSEEGDLISGNNRNRSNSSIEHDVLSEEHIEDAKKLEESSGQERNDPNPDAVKVQHPDEEDQNSDDGKVLEEEMETEERVGIDTCSADPCWSEPELSLGDQELSLTYSDNGSEGTEDSIHVYNERNQSPLRSHLVSSDTGIKESLSLHDKTSKNISVNRKPVNTSYYSRNRGPVQQDQRHQSGRDMLSSKMKKHKENDNNVFHIPRSSGRSLSPRGHQFVNYRSDERLQYFGSHERKDVSYNWETKQSCYHGADKNVDDLDQAVYSEYSDRENEDRFRENGNQYIRKGGDKRECYFERRTLIKYNEDNDWHTTSRKHYVDDDLSLLSYRESRQFLPKHSSFPAKDREAQRRIMHDKPHFKDGSCDYDQCFDEDEFEFLNRSYRMPSTFAEREMESLNNRHEEQFLQIDRSRERYTGRGRHHDRSPVVGDTMWSEEPEDEFPKYEHNQNSYLKYQRQSYTKSARHYMHRVNDSFRGHERHNQVNNRGNDWHCDYTDAAEDEDCTTSPVDECEFYPLPSEVPHWANNDNIVWHNDGFHPDEDALFYDETPRHERHVRNGNLHARVQRYDIKLQQHQMNLSKRDRDSFLKRSSKVMGGDHCRQTVLRCRKSVDMITWEGKSAKSSRVMCNDRLANVDQGIAAKRKALVGFDDSRKKTIKFDISKSQRDNENKKLLQNIPDKRQKKGLDIEEGEILTDEPSMEVSVSRRGVSESAALADSAKKRISQNGNNSELQITNFDSQKILDTLAKMEKRRERFKQPISVIKEAEKSLKLNTDSAVGICEIKQNRPARKRRWNGG
ncbi:FIP1[V] protein [Trifolium repens]|nr:FIP1[V] protein [Trifolium repens]